MPTVKTVAIVMVNALPVRIFQSFRSATDYVNAVYYNHVAGTVVTYGDVLPDGTRLRHANWTGNAIDARRVYVREMVVTPEEREDPALWTPEQYDDKTNRGQF